MGDLNFSQPPSIAVRSEIAMWRLNKSLGKKVRKVEVDYSFEYNEHIIRVSFFNGHILTCRESELDSDEFRAQCLMVYDLLGP
jgi:hypothetical protein